MDGIIICLSKLPPNVIKRHVIIINTIIVCTDLSGKELHRQVGVGIVMTSGSLCGVMVEQWLWNARDVGLSPALGTVFSIVITPTTIHTIFCYSCPIAGHFVWFPSRWQWYCSRRDRGRACFYHLVLVTAWVTLAKTAINSHSASVHLPYWISHVVELYMNYIPIYVGI